MSVRVTKTTTTSGSRQNKLAQQWRRMRQTKICWGKKLYPKGSSNLFKSHSVYFFAHFFQLIYFSGAILSAHSGHTYNVNEMKKKLIKRWWWLCFESLFVQSTLNVFTKQQNCLLDLASTKVAALAVGRSFFIQVPDISVQEKPHRLRKWKLY